ncbi:MAG: restriction endonuclease subunit S [Actinomycetota bacterium]|nr:restriction endonuclease subunit S [Actinomycetota bacterium]
MGQSPPSETYNDIGDGLAFLQGKSEFTHTHPAPTKWTTKPLRRAPTGSTLVSVRAPVGDSNLADQEYAIGRGVAALVPSAELDHYFLFLWVTHMKPELEARATGSTFKAINKAVLAEQSIPVPPLPEQRVIAHVLRTVQSAREATEQVIDAARELKQSLMRHLFTYGPEKHFAVEPKDWPLVPLRGAVHDERPICYGILKPGPHIDGGVPYVKVRDYPDGCIRKAALSRTTEGIARQYQRSQLRAGDILVSIRGTTGRVAVVPGDLEGANITQDTARVSPAADVDRDFLAYFLQSDEAQRFIRSWTKGAAVRGINLRELRELRVPVPPLEEQQAIAARLRCVDWKARVEKQRRSALLTLFNTLLHDLMTARIRVPVDESMKVAV